MARRVHLGFDEPLGKATEDADEEVEDSGDSGEVLGCLHGVSLKHTL